MEMGDDLDTCPLCTEEMDATDRHLKPCQCGYQICVWCWHHLMEVAAKDNVVARCPACRTLYDKDKVVGAGLNCEELMDLASDKRKSHKSRVKAMEGRKHLSIVRVVQRNLVYVVGFPVIMAEEETLERREFFGQYGKILKIAVSRSAGQHSHSTPTASVYVTFVKEEDAVRCIRAVDGSILEGKILRACFGTNKYCNYWLKNMPCNNPDCLYLHEEGSEEDSYTKEEMLANKNQYFQELGRSAYRPAGIGLPPPVYEASTSTTPMASSPTPLLHTNKSTTKNSSSVGSPGKFTSLPAAAAWGLRGTPGKSVVSSSKGGHTAATTACRKRAYNSQGTSLSKSAVNSRSLSVGEQDVTGGTGDWRGEDTGCVQVDSEQQQQSQHQQQQQQQQLVQKRIEGCSSGEFTEGDYEAVSPKEVSWLDSDPDNFGFVNDSIGSAVERCGSAVERCGSAAGSPPSVLNVGDLSISLLPDCSSLSPPNSTSAERATRSTAAVTTTTASNERLKSSDGGDEDVISRLESIDLDEVVVSVAEHSSRRSQGEENIIANILTMDLSTDGDLTNLISGRASDLKSPEEHWNHSGGGGGGGGVSSSGGGGGGGGGRQSRFSFARQDPPPALDYSNNNSSSSYFGVLGEESSQNLRLRLEEQQQQQQQQQQHQRFSNRVSSPRLDFDAAGLADILGARDSSSLARTSPLFSSGQMSPVPKGRMYAPPGFTPTCSLPPPGFAFRSSPQALLSPGRGHEFELMDPAIMGVGRGALQAEISASRSLRSQPPPDVRHFNGADDILGLGLLAHQQQHHIDLQHHQQQHDPFDIGRRYDESVRNYRSSSSAEWMGYGGAFGTEKYRSGLGLRSLRQQQQQAEKSLFLSSPNSSSSSPSSPLPLPLPSAAAAAAAIHRHQQQQQQQQQQQHHHHHHHHHQTTLPGLDHYFTSEQNFRTGEGDIAFV